MNASPRVLRRILLWLLLAGAVHALALWALPHVVMRAAMSRLVSTAAGDAEAATAEARVRAVYPPLATAASRVIVLPSPDLAYALCAYDLTQGPVDVDARPAWSAYWSVALYADNTDNYLVRSDLAAAKQPVHWRLSLASGVSTAGRELIVAPSARGLVLMRVLVADRASQSVAVAEAQRALRCQPVTG
jgi:uncharacterized membrane protein